jgi:hypothetical protein
MQHDSIYAAGLLSACNSRLKGSESVDPTTPRDIPIVAQNFILSIAGHLIEPVFEIFGFHKHFVQLDWVSTTCKAPSDGLVS